MRWTAAVLLRPITFVLAVVVAVVVGNHSDSFWYGLLAFFVAMGAGRVIGALVRGLPRRAVDKAIWPAAVTGYAFLFAALGLPPWASFFVSWIAASLTKGAMPRQHRRWTVSTRRIDFDELLP
jgi:hypothetical protein